MWSAQTHLVGSSRSVCTIATTCYSTMSWHYGGIKSCVDRFSPIKLHKPTKASDPTHCPCAHDMSIRSVQVKVTLYLDRSDRSQKLRCLIGLLTKSLVCYSR